MSDYLDFIGDKITKKEKKEGIIAVGAAIAAVVIAKHLIDKDKNSNENIPFQVEEENNQFEMELEDEFSYLDEPEPQIDPFSSFEN